MSCFITIPLLRGNQAQPLLETPWHLLYDLFQNNHLVIKHFDLYQIATLCDKEMIDRQLTIPQKFSDLRENYRYLLIQKLVLVHFHNMENHSNQTWSKMIVMFGLMAMTRITMMAMMMMMMMMMMATTLTWVISSLLSPSTYSNHPHLVQRRLWNCSNKRHLLPSGLQINCELLYNDILILQGDKVSSIKVHGLLSLSEHICGQRTLVGWNSWVNSSSMFWI